MSGSNWPVIRGKIFSIAWMKWLKTIWTILSDMKTAAQSSSSLAQDFELYLFSLRLGPDLSRQRPIVLPKTDKTRFFASLIDLYDLISVVSESMSIKYACSVRSGQEKNV